jgi:hypothetical protein
LDAEACFTSQSCFLMRVSLFLPLASHFTFTMPISFQHEISFVRSRWDAQIHSDKRGHHQTGHCHKVDKVQTHQLTRDTLPETRNCSLFRKVVW